MNIGMLFAPLTGSEKRVLLVSGLVLLILFGAILWAAHGSFTYIQDDAYIHLQVARTLAESGTWGITPGFFASASSSPLWTVLLAFSFLLLGDATLYVPLLVNVLAVLIIVVLLLRVLYQLNVRGTFAYFALSFIAIVTPLGPFAFGGMEHAPHIIAVLLFVCALSSVLATEKVSRSTLYTLFISTVFVTGLRYEGIFVVLVGCGLLLLRRRYLIILSVALLGMLPLVVFGYYSVLSGGHFVPNTLLVKKNLGLGLAASLHSMASAAYLNIKTPLFMMFTASMLATLVYRIRKDGSLWTVSAMALTIFGGSFILQSIFGKLSWVPMFRYEAYLVLGGVLFLIVCLRDLKISAIVDTKQIFTWSNAVLCILLLLLSLPLLRRGISWPYAVFNARDIHAATYSTAQFFAREYPNSTIGTIDIGMVSYYGQPAGVRVIDFWGLADNDVAQARLEGTYDSSTVREFAGKKDVRALALFDSWLRALIPQSFIRVASWTMSKNVTLGSDVISFYAPTCADAPVLEEHMRTFAEQLPAEVVLTMEDWRSTSSCSASSAQ